MSVVDDIPNTRVEWFAGLDRLLERQGFPFRVGSISKATTHVKMKPALHSNYLAVRLRFNRDPMVLVQLVFPPPKDGSRTDYPRHIELLRLLRKDQRDIDDAFMKGMRGHNMYRAPLQWGDHPKKECDIRIQYDFLDPNNKAEWEHQRALVAKSLEVLHSAFRPRIEAICDRR